MQKAFPLPVMEFPLPEEVPTASEEKFRDSYESPKEDATTASDGSMKKKGRIVAVTTEDMQKRKNNVKARTTLLLSLPDEHQLRFSKYKTTQELWAVILKTFGGNEATKKTKKNLLKQQYGNFKAEGIETLEQTFNRLQMIVSQLKFMDIEIEQDDLNQKFLTMNEDENHALVAEEEAPTEFALMAKTNAESLSHVEGRLAEFKSQEIKFCEKIRGLELQVEFKTNRIESLTNKLELLKKEKGILKFADDTITDYSRPSPAIESTLDDVQNRNSSETEASSSTISSKPFIKFVKATVKPTKNKTVKLESIKKPVVKYVEQYRKPSKKSTVKGNQRNWNNLKSQQFGENFEIKNMACFYCGHFDHLSYDCGLGVKKRRSYPKNNCYNKSMTPRAVIHKPYRSSMRPVRPNMNVAQPKRTSFHKLAHSYSKRPFQRTSAVRSQYRALWVSTVNRNFPTVNRKFPTVNRKFPTGSTKFSIVDMGKRGNAVKASACWIWKPRHNTTNKGPNSNSVSVMFKKYTYIDTQGRLKVLVNKSQNKTPYELFNGRTPTIGFLKPFGCHVMTLNTLDNLEKFEAKGDEENKAIEKSAGRNWLFDIDSLTNSMNYMPVEGAGTHSTNLSGTKDAASQAVKKDVSSLRYIAFPNWVHNALLESPSSNAQDTCKADASENIRNLNPTASTTNPLADQMETLTVETSIPTVSSPVSTACFTDSQKPSSDTTLISKKVTNQEETPSLDNILTLTNRFEDIIGVTTKSNDSNGVEADVSNMETTITASPTPTLRIHKDHLKSQIIGPVDTPIQTRHKSKEKKDDRGIVIRSKARLVAQGHTQEEGIDYDEDLEFPTRVYKVEKAMYGLHQAPRAWYVYMDDIIFRSSNPQLCREFEALMHEKFQMSTIGDILKKFGYSDVRSANTPMDKENPWGKDGTGKDVDLHLFRSMIESLMYLTASRPDIMFAVCACSRHQVTPKECHLHAVKRIFRYLKGHPKLGLWYPKESPFDLVTYSDSDYGGATQDRKSTTEWCQFLGRRLISWQCKK
nr:hypothetical protein [Tanacetum cinerariifolium]